MPLSPSTIFADRARILGQKVVTEAKLFVIGDSFSSIRRTGSTDATNGRFSTATGWNLWDWFRFGFTPSLIMDITTNFAREGAYAFRDWVSPPVWSAISPIPSMDSQITQLIALNPVGSIAQFDVVGVMIGTNDGINPDGGVKPTGAQVQSAITAGLNRLVTHGFKNFVIVYPESKHQPTLPALLTPDINTLISNNRGIKFFTCFADSSLLEFSNPYLVDNTHPNDAAHERLGEIVVSQFLNQSWVDRTQNLYLSAKGASIAAPRELGFTNFDPNTHGTRFVLADQFNCFEAIGNKRLTIKSYNGLIVNAAFDRLPLRG